MIFTTRVWRVHHCAQLADNSAWPDSIEELQNRCPISPGPIVDQSVVVDVEWRPIVDHPIGTLYP